ncbi:MAG: MFS transporter [Shimia sp.]
MDRSLIVVLSAGNFLVGVAGFLVIGTLEPVAEGLGVSIAATGLLLSVYAVAYAVASPLLVALTGRIGRRRVMTAGLVIMGASALASALAPSFAVLAALRIPTAIGAGLYTPVAVAVAGALAPPEARAKTLAYVFLGLTLAQVIGVPAGAWVAYAFGWRAAFWLVVLLSVPCIWAVWTRVPRGLAFQPVGLGDLGAMLRNVPMMLAITFTATFLAGIYVLYTYLPALLSGAMGWDRNGVTLALFVFGIGAVIGNVVLGPLADRVGNVRLLTALCCGQAVLMPLFVFLPLPNAVALGLILIWSVSGWGFVAAQQSRLVRLAGATAPVALGLNAASIYVGGTIGSAIGALVLTGFGTWALGLFGGMVALAALAHITVSARVSGS